MTRTQGILASLLISWLVGIVVEADEAPPATQAVVDQSTPQGALLLLVRALESGDADKAVEVSQVRDDDDREMLTTVALASKAHADLRKAIRAKWGEDVLPPEAQIDTFSRVFTEYDFTEPHVTETGDTAKADLRDKRGTIYLVREEGRWKISLADCMKDYKGYPASSVAKTFQRLEELATETLDKLNKGEYESYDKLIAELKAREKAKDQKDQQRPKGGF